MIRAEKRETSTTACEVPADSADPVYEAKARVLNRAVRDSLSHDQILDINHHCRSKRWAWESTNGSCSSSLALDGPTIICGQLSHL